MSPPVDPVASDPTLPARTDVVVIGGGIVGVSTALFLAEKGIAVTLCEKGCIGGEQSSRNWGWCRTMGRDVGEIPLAMESLRLWRDMNQRTGRETGFRQSGIMYLCRDEAEVASQDAWLGQAKQYQVDARLLKGAELEAVMQGASKSFIAGLHTPSDGKAEPALAAPAIAEAARDHGAQIFTNTAVRGIDQTAGRISGVVTERGRIAREDCRQPRARHETGGCQHLRHGLGGQDRVAFVQCRHLRPCWEGGRAARPHEASASGYRWDV